MEDRLYWENLLVLKENIVEHIEENLKGEDLENYKNGTLSLSDFISEEELADIATASDIRLV